MRKMMWKIPAKNCEYRDRTKLNCLEASRAKCLNCQNFIISDTISKKSVLYFRREQAKHVCLPFFGGHEGPPYDAGTKLKSRKSQKE